jgi:hypothetical protein
MIVLIAASQLGGTRPHESRVEEYDLPMPASVSNVTWAEAASDTDLVIHMIEMAFASPF